MSKIMCSKLKHSKAYPDAMRCDENNQMNERARARARDAFLKPELADAVV